MKPYLRVLTIIVLLVWRCGAAEPKDGQPLPKSKKTADKNVKQQAEMEKKAAQGEVMAQFEAGVWYADGAGGKTNSFKGYEWLRKAAEQGHVEAQRRVGEMLVNGIGTESDVKQGIQWLVKAAEKSDIQAQLDLGAIYHRGLVIDENLIEAFKWYSMAAQQGDAAAQGILGRMYAQGKGVGMDINKARMWLEKAAALKNAEAASNLGITYLPGAGGNPDLKQAFNWSLRAAEMGAPEAQFRVAQMYGEGVGVEQNMTKVVEWLSRAAQSKHPKALHKLGVIYAVGMTGEKDLFKTAELFEAAARAGDVEAQSDLGQAYIHGLGKITPDSRKAYVWVSAAAVQGYPIAQYTLGAMYKSGLGVPQSNIETLKWMYLSADQGYEPAIEARKIENGLMKPEEKVEARQRADAFRPITDRIVMADDMEEVTVAMDEAYRIPVQIFGQAKKFLVDTGAGKVFLDESFKPKLGSPVGEVYVAGLKINNLRMIQYQGPEISVGKERMKGDSVVVDNFEPFRKAIKGELDGAMGLNYLKKYVVTFDPGNGRLIIGGSVPEEVRRNGSAVSMEVRGDYCYVRAQIPGGQSIRLLLDSGDISFMSLKEADWKLIFPKGVDKAKPRDFLGAGGRIIHGVEANIPSITIGTNVYDKIAGSTSKLLTRSTLGQGFFKQNVVTIDFPNGLLYVMPGKLSVATQ